MDRTVCRVQERERINWLQKVDAAKRLSFHIFHEQDALILLGIHGSFFKAARLERGNNSTEMARGKQKIMPDITLHLPIV